jgi:hypothetical protein
MTKLRSNSNKNHTAPGVWSVNVLPGYLFPPGIFEFLAFTLLERLLHGCYRRSADKIFSGIIRPGL